MIKENPVPPKAPTEADQAIAIVEAMQDTILQNMKSGDTESVQSSMLITMGLIYVAQRIADLEMTLRRNAQ